MTLMTSPIVDVPTLRTLASGRLKSVPAQPASRSIMAVDASSEEVLVVVFILVKPGPGMLGHVVRPAPRDSSVQAATVRCKAFPKAMPCLRPVSHGPYRGHAAVPWIRRIDWARRAAGRPDCPRGWVARV